MTKTTVILAICRNIVWKETAKYLKHFRMKSEGDLKLYNAYAHPLIEMYRKTEYDIEYNNLRYTKFEYRKKILDLEQKILKKLAKDK